MHQETIKASEFKAKCLALMDEVALTGESITITKNGKPVAQLSPFRKKPKSIFGLHKGMIEIIGDIEAPLYTQKELDGFLDREMENILGTRRSRKNQGKKYGQNTTRYERPHLA